MNIFTSILLGAIQGLTEFLPVSSSGHLVIAQELLPGFSQTGILFDVVLHAGTVMAVLYYFRKAILKLNSKYIILLLIGSVPAGIVGILLNNSIENIFKGTQVVGIALLVTAFFNYLTDRAKKGTINITSEKSFMVGIAQALAIIPGISRSGATIFTGTRLGIDKKEAAQFSFLLSIPAIIGANIVQFFEYGRQAIDYPVYYIIGFGAAFISGVIAIKYVLKFLLSNKFKLFSYYCAALGILVLLLL